MISYEKRLSCINNLTIVIVWIKNTEDEIPVAQSLILVKLPLVKIDREVNLNFNLVQHDKLYNLLIILLFL